jgi:RNase adaptor protein for sRNA GlmZ degradation
LFQKKASFIKSIPPALSNLFELITKKSLEKDFPYLFKIVKQLSQKHNQPATMTSDKLNIKISSFSYKIGGIPIDKSGNGGGFVFDCRGLLNPGRFDEYKKLTGIDKSVIEFLKNKTKADSFISNSLAVVKPTIENYIEREFDSLMISFGCTGGQHRSVYCAESIYKTLKKDTRFSVQLEHIEQGISKS